MGIFRRKEDGATDGDVAERAMNVPSESSKIQSLESRTDDALKRMRAIGVRVDVYELRRKDDLSRRS